MSHAGQLLAESPQLTPEDKRLTEIIRGNAERVSTIINNVLQLSRRETTKLERLTLQEWLQDFRSEFCETMQWPAERLTISTRPSRSKCVRTRPSCIRLSRISVRQRHPPRLRRQ